MHKLSTLIRKLDKNQIIRILNCRHTEIFKGKVNNLPEDYLSWLVLEIKGLLLPIKTLTILIVEDITI